MPYVQISPEARNLIRKLSKANVVDHEHPEKRLPTGWYEIWLADDTLNRVVEKRMKGEIVSDTIIRVLSLHLNPKLH